jgi:copper resistance protein D
MSSSGSSPWTGIMTWLVVARAVHYGTCLLFFGVLASDRFVAASILRGGKNEAADYWMACLRRFVCVLLPVILLSGIAWFVLVAANMSGLPVRQAIHPEILETVWGQTLFGTDWKWRLVFWLAAAVAAVLFLFKSPTLLQKILAWMLLLFSGLLLGSLAWAGHGLEGPDWHLAADVLHLLLAGMWPAGLLPFALLLRRLRRSSDPEQWKAMALLVRRFSALSLGTVALLGVTGFVNGWILVGSFANLIGQTYGRWLLAKIILFGIAVAIGAVNLLRLKPRLASQVSQTQNAEPTAAQLQFNVQMELILGTAIVIVVAVLGILPPAIH